LSYARRVLKAEVTVLVDDYAGFTKFFSEHGFSVSVLIGYEDGSSYSVLVDLGTSGRILLYNASVAGVELKSINAVVLSHRHYDHSGGLARLSKLLRDKPLLGHPDILKPCYSVRDGSARFNVGLSPEIRKSISRFELVLLREHMELSADVWFLGEIERHYDNSYAVKGFKTLRDGTIVDEPMLDDTGLAIRVGDKALVIAGCSHSGISNIVRKARKLTGVAEIVVLGGLHLAQAEQQDIMRVVGELEAEGVTEVHAGHCTGLKGEAALLRKFEDKMRKIHSGYRLRLTQ